MPSIPTYAFPEQRIYPFHIEQLGHLNKYDPGDFHRHDYFEIFLFNEGGGFHYIDFVTVPIQANSVHFVTPGQVHKIARAPESTGFVIIFPTDFIAISPDTNDFLFQFPLFYHKTDQPVLTITPEQFRQLIEAVESMLVESKGNNPQKKRILQSYLHILLCKCQYWFQLQQEAVLAFAQNNVQVGL